MNRIDALEYAMMRVRYERAMLKSNPTANAEARRRLATKIAINAEVLEQLRELYFELSGVRGSPNV